MFDCIWENELSSVFRRNLDQNKGYFMTPAELIYRMLLDRRTCSSMSILFLIFAGINLTGMYFNPAMATGHTFGCKGTTAWEHVVVYWIGPFIGCFLAMLMDRMLHIDAAATVAMETKKKKWFDTKCTLHVRVPFRWFKDLLVDTQSIPLC